MPKGDESHKVLGDAPGFKSNSMWFQTLSLSIESLYTKENEWVCDQYIQMSHGYVVFLFIFIL